MKILLCLILVSCIFCIGCSNDMKKYREWSNKQPVPVVEGWIDSTFTFGEVTAYKLVTDIGYVTTTRVENDTAWITVKVALTPPPNDSLMLLPPIEK